MLKQIPMCTQSQNILYRALLATRAAAAPHLCGALARRQRRPVALAHVRRHPHPGFSYLISLVPQVSCLQLTGDALLVAASNGFTLRERANSAQTSAIPSQSDAPVDWRHAWLPTSQGKPEQLLRWGASATACMHVGLRDRQGWTCCCNKRSLLLRRVPQASARTQVLSTAAKPPQNIMHYLTEGGGNAHSVTPLYSAPLLPSSLSDTAVWAEVPTPFSEAAAAAALGTGRQTGGKCEGTFRHQ